MSKARNGKRVKKLRFYCCLNRGLSVALFHTHPIPPPPRLLYCSNREDFLTVEPTVESYTDTPTIALDAKQALGFQSLSAFTPNGSGKITWQLSPDAGTTWYFYSDEKSSWKQADPDNPDHRATGQAINDHLADFPQGTGKLLWRAYLEEATATLDSLRIDYTTDGTVKGIQSTVTSPSVLTLSSGLATSINRLFSLVHDRIPTFSEWQYWADRVVAGDKDGQLSLLGAMQWQQLFGPTSPDGLRGAGAVAGVITAGPMIEIRNGTNKQGLARRTLTRLTKEGYAVLTATNAQDFLRETSKVYVINPEAHDTGQQLANELNTQFGLDLPTGERRTEADLLLVLGYDFEE